MFRKIRNKELKARLMSKDLLVTDSFLVAAGRIYDDPETYEIELRSSSNINSFVDSFLYSNFEDYKNDRSIIEGKRK